MSVKKVIGDGYQPKNQSVPKPLETHMPDVKGGYKPPTNQQKSPPTVPPKKV